jgi:hypothetical protein
VRLGGPTSGTLMGNAGGSESLITASAGGLETGAAALGADSLTDGTCGKATGAAGGSTGFDATTSGGLRGGGGASACGSRSGTAGGRAASTEGAGGSGGAGGPSGRAGTGGGAGSRGSASIGFPATTACGLGGGGGASILGSSSETAGGGAATTGGAGSSGRAGRSGGRDETGDEAAWPGGAASVRKLEDGGSEPALAIPSLRSVVGRPEVLPGERLIRAAWLPASGRVGDSGWAGAD